MSLDASIISYVARQPAAFLRLQRAGIESEHFMDDYKRVWTYMSRIQKQQGSVPSPAVLRAKFPDLEFPRVRSGDLAILVRDLRQRKKHRDFVEALNDAVMELDDFESVDDAARELQQKINELSTRDGASSHLIDLFSAKTNKRVLADIQKRRSGKLIGLPTGLKRFDLVAGGWHRRQLTVIMGRPGLGKSWLDLLFVASAVLSGHKIMLFPLEMTLEETAMRLYTIFSQKCFGATKVLKHHDLTMGRVNTRRVAKFLGVMEDRFKGQLLVSDIGALSDPYTVERVEAEVALHRPDGFWLDYITLMKMDRDKRMDEMLQTLSSGLKGAAVRQGCAGGCSAQVNREALRVNAFIPRLEHIAGGDPLGRDADAVLSINKRGKTLYYGLVKHRHGPEFGKTKSRFLVNEGLIEDLAEENEDAADE